jgi:hypothetical protein
MAVATGTGVSGIHGDSGPAITRYLATAHDSTAAMLGRRMANKVSVRLLYTVVILIVLLTAGFLALGIRAFASAVTADFIFLGAFGVILVTLPLYFILRRCLEGAAIDRKIFRVP